MGLEVKVSTALTDMHSGMKGGSVANPNTVLAHLLAGLHHPGTARVMVPGFYEVGVLWFHCTRGLGFQGFIV